MDVPLLNALPDRWIEADCHTRLATDAPDEGSGLILGGRSRLQHMSGSRGWPWCSLGPWPDWCVASAGEPVEPTRPRR